MTKSYVRRLRPGDDLVKGIQQIVGENSIQAGVITSAVGSLTGARLRLAGADKFVDLDGPFEIVSITGTVGVDGMHVHLAIADKEGRTFGGHLLEGCTIYTTAEIVISAVDGYRFRRTQDPATGYPELDV